MSEQSSTDIRVIKLEEALADKLKCLLQRLSSFDLYDLVHAIFITKDIEVDPHSNSYNISQENDLRTKPSRGQEPSAQGSL